MRRRHLATLLLLTPGLASSTGVQRAGTDVLGVIEYGQSNAEGQARDGAALLRVQYPGAARLRMPRTPAGNVWLGLVTVGGRSTELHAGDIAGLMPLTGAMGSPSHGSTAGESMVLRLFEREIEQGPSPGPEIVLINAAEGGQRIHQLRRDPDAGFHAFKNLMLAIQAADTQLRSEGKQFRVRMVLMAQGESDGGNEGLGRQHELVRAEIESAVQGITGQKDSVLMLTLQPSSFLRQETWGVLSILEAHSASQARRGSLFCLGPSYSFPFASDFLHHSSIGHDQRGEMCAVASEHLLRSGNWEPLHVRRAWVHGPSTLAMEMSEPAIQATAPHVAPVEDCGIELEGGAVAALAFQGQRLLIETQGPATAVLAIRFGLSGHRSANRRSSEIPRTNVRSATAYGAFRDGSTIYKWLCHQRTSLSASH